MELDAKTFDLIEALSGVSYPEEEVKVYLDESIGYTLNTLNEGIRLAISAGESAKAEKLQKELDKVKKSADKAALTVVLRGIPETSRQAIVREVDETFPAKKNVFGQDEVNIEADALFRRLSWKAYIVKIVDPSGRVNLPGDAEIDALLSLGGSTLYEAIDTGITKLILGTKAGFESAAQDTDFLSKA